MSRYRGSVGMSAGGGVTAAASAVAKTTAEFMMMSIHC